MRSFPVMESDIEALVDSQLGWEEEKRVLAEIEKNPALRDHYLMLVNQKKRLIAWWKGEEGMMRWRRRRFS